MWLWLAALACFFLPQGIAVIELSRRYPAEGGVYVWTKEIFGDLHGFLCGWCYWTANMFFIPTLLFYLLGHRHLYRRPRTWPPLPKTRYLFGCPHHRPALVDRVGQYPWCGRRQVGQ